MNNIIKMRVLTPLVFTLIAIGLFEISTASMFDDIFADKDKEKINNIVENTATTSDSSKDTTENVLHWIQEAVDRFVFLTKILIFFNSSFF